MAALPVHKLKKQELVWLGTHNCKKHYHPYIQHYQCYLREHPEVKQKVGFFDIEASNLDADFGICFAYCIKEGWSKKIRYGIITQKQIHSNKLGHEDKQVIESCIKDLLDCDRIVTWYGKRFDVPFIRTRALIMGVKFPPYGSVLHDDPYYVSKFRLKLSSNRLENVSRVLFGESMKTHINPAYWRAAMRGHKKALRYILDHCKRDVLDLERTYYKLEGHSAPKNQSM